MNQLVRRRSELSRLEQIIERELETFYEVGMAFARIKEAKLYKVTNTSWQGYLKDRWGFSRQHAHKILQAAQIADRIIEAFPEEARPTSEYQLRPLAKLPEEQQPEAWRDSVKSAAGDFPTYREVRKVVEQRLPQEKRFVRTDGQLEPILSRLQENLEATLDLLKNVRKKV